MWSQGGSPARRRRGGKEGRASEDAAAGKGALSLGVEGLPPWERGVRDGRKRVVVLVSR